MKKKSIRKENNTHTKQIWKNVDQAANRAPEWMKTHIHSVSDDVSESINRSKTSKSKQKSS